jgi:hypothetical protein
VVSTVIDEWKGIAQSRTRVFPSYSRKDGNGHEIEALATSLVPPIAGEVVAAASFLPSSPLAMPSYSGMNHLEMPAFAGSGRTLR